MLAVLVGNLYQRTEQSLGLKPSFVACLLLIGGNQQGAASTSMVRVGGVGSLKSMSKKPCFVVTFLSLRKLFKALGTIS